MEDFVWYEAVNPGSQLISRVRLFTGFIWSYTLPEGIFWDFFFAFIHRIIRIDNENFQGYVSSVLLCLRDPKKSRPLTRKNLTAPHSKGQMFYTLRSVTMSGQVKYKSAYDWGPTFFIKGADRVENPHWITPRNWTQDGKLSASISKCNLHPQRAYQFWECTFGSVPPSGSQNSVGFISGEKRNRGDELHFWTYRPICLTTIMRPQSIQKSLERWTVQVEPSTTLLKHGNIIPCVSNSTCKHQGLVSNSLWRNLTEWRLMIWYGQRKSRKNMSESFLQENNWRPFYRKLVPGSGSGEKFVSWSSFAPLPRSLMIIDPLGVCQAEAGYKICVCNSTQDHVNRKKYLNEKAYLSFFVFSLPPALVSVGDVKKKHKLQTFTDWLKLSTSSERR